MALTLLQAVNRAELQLGLTASSTVASSSVAQAQQMLAIANGILEELMHDFEWQRCVYPYYFTTTLPVVATCSFTSATAVVSVPGGVAGILQGMVLLGGAGAPYAEVASVTTADSTITMNYPAQETTASASVNFVKQDYPLPTGYDRMVSDTNWDRTDHWRNLGPKTSQEWQWLQGGIISTGPRERWRIIDDKIRYFSAPASPLNIAFEYVSNLVVIASGGSAPTKAAFTADSDTFIFKDEVLVKGLKYHWKQ